MRRRTDERTAMWVPLGRNLVGDVRKPSAVGRRMEAPTMMNDNELPGMWESADFTGGATDSPPRMNDNELADCADTFTSERADLHDPLREIAARIRELTALNDKWDVLLAERIAEIAELRGEVERLRAERDHQQGRADGLQQKLDLWMAKNG